jgi:release factor H-coupled RctB family protein
MDPSTILPAHARVVARDDVWMEGRAIDQLAHVACMPGCCKAVGMPDLHPGRGIPIGAAFAFEGVIRPALVGGDAGCGVRWTVVRRARFKGDALVRRLDEAFATTPWSEVDPTALVRAAWTDGPRGVAALEGVPFALARWLSELEPVDLMESGPLLEGLDPQRAADQLGTAGGGNHFLELARVDAIEDGELARAQDLRSGALVVLAHSGSRGLGGLLHAAWAGKVLESPEAQQRYASQLAGACRYAITNRALLTWRMLQAMGATSVSRLGLTQDVLHNTVLQTTWRGKDVWLHRKGAAPAEQGRPTVVLGSRGAPSFIMQGLGQEDALWSAAHGAGRKLGRKEAKSKLSSRYTRASLRRSKLGGRVVCDDPELLLTEHPDAYKPVVPVVDSLVDAGIATPTVSLVPVVTVKR